MKGKYAQGRIRQKTTLEKGGNAPNGGNRIYRKPHSTKGTSVERIRQKTSEGCLVKQVCGYPHL